MLDHLRHCEDKRLSRLLPAGVKVAHKTGSVAVVRTDAGLIEAKSGPIAICVLTNNNKDQRWSEENAGEVLTSKIARAVYDHFEGIITAAADQPRRIEDRRRRASLFKRCNERSTPARSRRRFSPSMATLVPATEAAVKEFQRAKELARHRRR